MENKDNSLKALRKYIDAAQHKKVLVIGDVMLDRFVYGTVNRISPESDAPILNVSCVKEMEGGAANVAANLRALGMSALLIGVAGNDESADKLSTILKDDFLIIDDKRPTTLKTRYISGAGQLLRVDEEISNDISAPILEKILSAVSSEIKSSDAVILSDYNKGVLTPALIKELISIAREHDVPVLVDPKKQDYSLYKGAYLVTPNRSELSNAVSMPVNNKKEIIDAANKLKNDAGLSNLVVTLSEQGISVFENDQDPIFIDHEPLEVVDVSGAGDTAISGLALGVVAGASLEQAAQIANKAGGIVVTKSGTSRVDVSELVDGLDDVKLPKGGLNAHDALICNLSDAAKKIDGWKEKGLQVGFTNGCFDILHFGHVNYLNRAREKCDRLVVGLNHDASVRILKGPERPLHDQDSRASVIGALGAVDMVVFFGAEKEGDDNTPCALIEAIKPDIYFKGGDYSIDQLPEAKIMEQIGGRTELMNLYEGHSTTATIEKMKNTEEAA